MVIKQPSQTAFFAGLRNSLRLVFKDKKSQFGDREWFVRTVVVAGLKVDPAQIFFLHWNAADGGYDLTLNSQQQYVQIQATFEEKAEIEPFSRFRVVPPCQRNLTIVTIQVYNPYVGDEAVAGFLRRYGNVDMQPKYLRDSFGIWTGRRQFRVLLREDPDSTDGLKHPPAYFSIGADRGFLFYSGQPVFCRQCRFWTPDDGLRPSSLPELWGNWDGAATCDAPRHCHGCGDAGHAPLVPTHTPLWLEVWRPTSRGHRRSFVRRSARQRWALAAEVEAEVSAA